MNYKLLSVALAFLYIGMTGGCSQPAPDLRYQYAHPWLMATGETKPDSRLAVQHRERCEWKTERNRPVSLAFQRRCR